MPNFYSVDLRQKVIDYLLRGGKALEAVKVFGICQDTVYRWKRQFEATKDLNPKEPVRSGYKHNHEEIRDFLSSHPDWTLVEVSQYFNVSPSTIRLVCLKFKITRKKRLYLTKKQIQLKKKSLEIRSKELRKKI